MSDETPDANDLLIAGRPLIADGERIDPRSVVVPIEFARAKRDAAHAGRTRSSGPSSSGPVEPPPFDEPPPGDGDGPPHNERPVIVVTTEEIEVNTAASAALAADRDLYVRGNAIVRVIRASTREVEQTVRDPDAPTIDIVPQPIIQERLSAAARFVRKVPDKENAGEFKDIPVHPPKWCVEAVRLRGEWPGFRQLEGIVETPVLRMDGSVLDQPGYDARSGLLFRGDGKAQPVPEKPTAEDVKAALEALADVVCDVYFARPAHRSSWLASLLTPLARAAFRGPAPLFLFEAPTAGSGKGLLVDVAVKIATGRSAPLSTFTSDNEEMKKSIVTWASSGRSVVVLDDVSGRLDGDALRSALTAPVVTGRLLGFSRDWTGPNLMTWYATGNNVQIGNEMFRRISHIRILSPVEDPSKRSGFKHPDLREHVARHAPELARAALTILRAYHVAGRPDQKLPSWGSYESWSALVRSAIVWAGWADPNDTMSELRSSADTRQSTYRALLAAWITLLRQKSASAVTAKQAIEHVCKSDPGPLPELRAIIEEIASDKHGRPSSKLLGYTLRSLKDRVLDTALGSVALQERGEDRNGTKLWTATIVAEPAGDAGNAGDHSVPFAGAIKEGSEFSNGGEDHPHRPHTPQSSLDLDPGDGAPWQPPDDEDSW